MYLETTTAADTAAAAIAAARDGVIRGLYGLGMGYMIIMLTHPLTDDCLRLQLEATTAAAAAAATAAAAARDGVIRVLYVDSFSDRWLFVVAARGYSSRSRSSEGWRHQGALWNLIPAAPRAIQPPPPPPLPPLPQQEEQRPLTLRWTHRQPGRHINA